MVTGRGAPPLASLDDLAGKKLLVRQSSSYFEHLKTLSDSLVAKGLQPIGIEAANEGLESEDLLEIVNAGLVPITVVDGYLANFWAQVFEDITIPKDLVVNDGDDIAWAIRKNSPRLKEELNAFVEGHELGSGFVNTLVKRYPKSTKHVKNATSEAEMQRFKATVDIFRKHAKTYGFDYLMLAQGYQESGLNQKAFSPRGAVGLMQLLPSTAADKAVGITGIETDPDRNVEAGAKYLRLMADTYLDDPAINDLNRTLMSFAAYNAGPGNIRKFSRLAEKQGRDPNKWFGNVEFAAAKVVGRGTVQYVANIYKYYIAYRLTTEPDRAPE